MPTTAEPTESPLLSLGEIADHLGLGISTVHRLVATGQLPAYRVGPRLVRVRKSDVEALLIRIPAIAS